MTLAGFSIHRRVTVLMLAVTGLLFGFIALDELQVNLLPDLSYPTLTVRTEFPGAAPLEIENLISEPIEEAVGVVKGVNRVTSVSSSEQSDVILQFSWGTDMDQAGLDVREKLEILQLPVESQRPVLLRFDPSSDPVMRLALSVKDSQKTEINALKYLRRHADEVLRKRLEPVEGVAAVKISGGLEDEIQVALDQTALSQLNLSPAEIVQRLKSENVNLSGGQLEEGQQRYLVRTVNQFKDVDEIAAMVVRETEGKVIHLRDIAEVESGFTEREAVIRLDGNEAVELSIYKEGDFNTVHMADGVEKRLIRLRKSLPDDLQLDVVSDQSIFVRQSIQEVVSAALIGGLLAILVVYWFLGEALATFIIGVTIPVSIITTFFLMYRWGISLNMMSLGGIALAAGLLVDNAIVVLENIARHRNDGLDWLKAAQKGTEEVTGAVVASTLTTVAVFIPLVFVQGIAGQLFRDQSLTVAFALMVSLLAALTLIPMLASLKSASLTDDPDGSKKQLSEFNLPEKRWKRPFYRLYRFFFYALPVWALKVFFKFWTALGKLVKLLMSPFRMFFKFSLEFLDGVYVRLLPWALTHRFFVVVIAALLLAGSINLARTLGMELIPELAQNQFLVNLQYPPGTPLDKTDQQLKKLQEKAQALESVDNSFGVSGTGNRLDASPVQSGEHRGELLVNMKPGTGDQSEAQVMNSLRAITDKAPGLVAEYNYPELFSFGTPLEIELVGYDLEDLKKVSDRLALKLTELPQLVDIQNSLEQGYPEVKIRFDQERVSALGLKVRTLADRVVQHVQGNVATQFTEADRKIDIRVRGQADQRNSLASLEALLVNPDADHPLPLSAVASIETGQGPAEIRRIDQERVAVISAGLAYGDLGSAVESVRAFLQDFKLPPGMNLRVTGQNEEMQSSFDSLKFALALAVFLVYLVMASQFESLLHPFVILFSIPLALVGAVSALWITGLTISVVVLIGLIMLAGIVVNNAIVLVDLINHLRAKGEAVNDAILKAGRLRLRPILMTTLTTILGLLPLALGIGEGAEVRMPMAITVMGGLSVSTLLTLVVVPVVYSFIPGKAPEYLVEAESQNQVQA